MVLTCHPNASKWTVKCYTQGFRLALPSLRQIYLCLQCTVATFTAQYGTLKLETEKKVNVLPQDSTGNNDEFQIYDLPRMGSTHFITSRFCQTIEHRTLRKQPHQQPNKQQPWQLKC